MLAHYITVSIVICFQVSTVHDFVNSPSAAKLEQLGEDRGKILLDFLGVSRQDKFTQLFIDGRIL